MAPCNRTGHRGRSETKIGRNGAPALTFFVKEATWVASPVLMSGKHRSKESFKP
jgi:hypothetical protein